MSLDMEGILRAYSKDLRSIELKGKTRAGEAGNNIDGMSLKINCGACLVPTSAPS